MIKPTHTLTLTHMQVWHLYVCT